MVEIKNIYGDVIYTAKDATTVKQAVEQAILSCANLSSADLSWANLSSADLSCANLSSANLSCANLSRANLYSANLSCALIDKKTIANLRQINVSSYPYQIQAVLFLDGSRWIRMGCLWKSLEDWKRDGGILNSNPSEFPNDRSEKSKERAAAFAFAKADALRMKLPKGEAKQ
jgi:enterochelin esterase-like enzyme